jgi:hypothetical protein
MTKTPEESFAEMMLRDKESNLHTGAYTFWRDSNYAKTEYYDKFKKFGRWWDPSWTVPDHVQPFIDLYAKYFVSHKVIPSDNDEGVQIHLNPSSEPEDPKNWRLWSSWTYTICVPYSLEDYQNWEPFKMIYYPWVDLRTTETHPFKFSRREYKTIEIKPFDRISFPSSGIAHKVLPSKNRCFWIFNDLRCDPDNLLHKHIDVKQITNVDDLRKDIVSLLTKTDKSNKPYVQQQFMSDLEYFYSFGRLPARLDWIPPNLELNENTL